MNSYGLSTLLFGNPAITGFLVQENTISQKNALTATVQNESGVVVWRHYDDLTTNLSLSMVFNGGTVPTAGSTFTYNGIVYEIESTDVKGSNKNATMVDVKGIKSQGIVYT